MALYNIKSQTTSRVVAFTTVSPFDSDWADENEILEMRVEAENNYSYTWCPFDTG